jgi:hypothetical protein
MGADYATSGRVYFSGGVDLAGVLARRQVNQSGHFKIDVSPGTWRVYGFTPKYNDGNRPCLGGTVTVEAGITLHQNVVCLEK